MKQNLRVSGELEFSQTELLDALLENAKKDKKIINETITGLVSAKYGYVVKKLATHLDSKGELVIRVAVSNSDNDLAKTLFEPEKKEVVRTPLDATGKPEFYNRKNKGFYEELVSFLKEQKKISDNKIDYDMVWSHIANVFPKVDARTFLQYVSNKKQWKQKGFTVVSREDKRIGSRGKMVRDTKRHFTVRG